MKKLIGIILAAAMAFSLAACSSSGGSDQAAPETEAPVETEAPAQDETVPAEPQAEGIPAEADAFLGTWVCGRATITFVREDLGIKATVRWAGSAAEVAEWNYAFDEYVPEVPALIDHSTGLLTHLTYGEDGEIAESEEIYSDGHAEFILNEDGTLLWNDKTENAGEDMVFEYVEIVETGAPTEQEFVDELFHVIGEIPQGTAGSSLAAAQAAEEVLQFAADHDLANADIDTLRSNMLAAWESMTPEEQSAFDSNLMNVVHMLDDSIADWDANTGVFEDAGVAEAMSALVNDPAAQEAWSTLVANIMTMGNSDGQ
ncbi:MAG: hypothetical protein IJU67_07355 [Lachnospiraceae bacterium]|nr:hypothetical protein [Lachnospiraceae bacterium]